VETSGPHDGGKKWGQKHTWATNLGKTSKDVFSGLQTVTFAHNFLFLKRLNFEHMTSESQSVMNSVMQAKLGEIKCG
jgi:hypothetical protein